MSRISFEGIGEVAATFACGEGVKAGQVVKLTGDGAVGPCGDGERFCGVALSAGEGFAAVQLGGLIRVAASGGALSEGWNRLLADGSGRTAPRRPPAANIWWCGRRAAAPSSACEKGRYGTMGYRFDNLRLEKGMYNEAGRSFTQVLEREDPSEQYKGTALEGLDAYQRQLKRFDIKVKGAGSDAVEKFFATSQSAVLFPEYIARSVRQGMEEANLLPHITAAVTRFDGMDYRSIASVPDDDQRALRWVEEGAAIPQTQVKTQENLVKLHKRGRMLVASYEAIRYQKLDLFSVTLRQIGAHINRMHLEDAIEVLLNGDGNDNPAEAFTVGTDPIGGTAGTLTYDELVDFWGQFEPYEMNTLLVSGDMMRQMLKLEEFQNPLTGLNFQGTGRLDTPLGAALLRTSALGGGTLIGLDRRYALEMVQGSDVLVEYDKLIDRQLERAAITSISGFAKLFTGAAKVLKLK